MSDFRLESTMNSDTRPIPMSNPEPPPTCLSMPLAMDDPISSPAEVMASFQALMTRLLNT